MKYKYHEYIDDWIQKVEKKKVHSCKEQKLLMPFLRNVLDGSDIVIRSKRIYDAVELMEKYFFVLHDFQRFLVAIIVGVYDNSGHLVFNQILVMMGRGTGKNGLISALSFYFLSNRNGIQKYNVDIVANSEEQALTSFEDVYGVIEDNPSLKNKYSYTKVKIKFKNTRSVLKYRTSNSKTKDGGRPGLVIFDEIHQYENYDNIKVFTGGLGKVEDPRRIYITTDGEIREGVLDDYKERARRVLSEEEAHRGFFPFIFKLDSIQEVGKFDLWDKAIPRIVYDETLRREVEVEYYEMLTNSDLKEAFLTKRMNIPFTQAAKNVADWDDIIATNQTMPDLSGCECIGAVDFADLRDFCSVGLLFKEGGKRHFVHHTFIHEKSLELTKFNVNIQEAVDDGFATIIKDCPIISASIVVDWFVCMSKKYYIKKVVADRFRFSALKECFDKEGLELVGIPSGSITHTKLHPLISQLFSERNLVFGDDKLMRWYCWNVFVQTSKNGNKTYLKIEPIKRKTDGFFAFLHAMSQIEELPDELNGIQIFDVIEY